MRIRSLILACLLASGASPLLADVSCEESANRFLATLPEEVGPVTFGLPLEEVMADPNGSLQVIGLTIIVTLIELMPAIPKNNAVNPMNGDLLTLTDELLECGEYYGWGAEHEDYLQFLQSFRIDTMNSILVQYVEMNSEDAG